MKKLAVHTYLANKDLYYHENIVREKNCQQTRILPILFKTQKNKKEKKKKKKKGLCGNSQFILTMDLWGIVFFCHTLFILKAFGKTRKVKP